MGVLTNDLDQKDKSKGELGGDDCLAQVAEAHHHALPMGVSESASKQSACKSP